MADIFHEVEEDLRRDQALAIWKKYGNYIIAAALLIVLVVAAVWGWREYTTRQQLQASADFLSAQAATDVKAREAALGTLATNSTSYGVLARFQLAAIANDAGDAAKARGILGEIANDAGADKALRDLATLEAALLDLQLGNADSAAALVKDLTKEGEAYRLSALEIAGLAALAAGDKEKAKASFEELKKLGGTDAPGAGVTQRADQMLDQLAN